MAQKKAYEVEKFLKNKPQSYKVVLIYGSDKGMVSEYAALFAKNCGVDDSDPFAVTKFSGDSLDKDGITLVNEAQTISFFGGKRLLWGSNLGSSPKTGLTNALKEILETPLADCYILIEAGELKKTAALRKLVEQSSYAIALPCYSDEGQSLQKLIADIVEQFNCTITDEAQVFLKNNLGNDRLISRGEIEKLCLYAQDSKHITLEDVKNSISDERALSQDEVIDAIITGDMTSFNSRFDRQISAGTPAFLILSALMRQFQQMHLMRFAMETEGKAASQVISLAKPPVFFKRKKIIEYALSLWNQQKIAKANERLNSALLKSRQNSELGVSIIRQNLLALTVEAARSR